MRMRIKKYLLFDDLAKDSLIMFLGTGFTNFFNLLYTVFLTRALLPQDFGVFNSLLAIMMLFSPFPSAITRAFTRFVSQFSAQGKYGEMKKLISLLNRRVFLIGFVIFLGIMLFHKPFSTFFKIPDGGIFLILSLMILLSYLSTIPQAILVGLQKFWYVSLVSFVSGLIKLLLVFVLIKAGAGVMGALGAFFIASFLSLVFSLYFQQKSLPRVRGLLLENNGFSLGNVYGYLFPVFLVTLAGTAFLNIDIILVKRFFEPLEAGLYSISQVAGKVVFFFASSLTVVMFPKVANLQAQNKDTVVILKKSLFYMFFLSTAVALIAIISPAFMLKILSGKVYKECFPLIRMFSVNMVLLSLIFIFMNYYLSLDKRKYLYIFLSFVALEIILISLFHNTLIQVLGLIFVLFLLLLIYNAYLVFYRKQRL
ncbi:MAG: oligosaccharide flippase family protein [Candidatus Omnitrophota bacterium]